MTSVDLERMRAALLDLGDTAYFYTGAEGPPLRGHIDAATRYIVDKSHGEEGRARFEVELSKCRDSLGALMGASPSSIAIVNNASDAINHLVASTGLVAGDNVVTSDLEFPAGVLPLVALAERGLDVRVLRTHDGHLDSADFEPLIDQNTRLVLSSHVSYLSGARIDPAHLKALAHAVGAAFVLDATQSLGVVPVDAGDADAVVSSSYKWLLAPHGLGILQVSDPARFAVTTGAVGWRSVLDLFAPDRFEKIHRHSDARVFELGFPSFIGIYLLNDSLDLLSSVGIEAIEHHVSTLTAPLVDGLSERGYTLLTPRDAAQRAGNVSFRHPNGRQLAEDLLSRGVRVWGGDGRVRFSVHGFNSRDDIDRGLAGLDGIA